MFSISSTKFLMKLGPAGGGVGIDAKTLTGFSGSVRLGGLEVLPGDFGIIWLNIDVAFDAGAALDAKIGGGALVLPKVLLLVTG